jgi:hypothetical protein
MQRRKYLLGAEVVKEIEVKLIVTNLSNVLKV